MTKLTRVAAIQTKRRTIPYKVATVAEALGQVRNNLDELTALAERAAEKGCQIIAFPEDTLGTLEWEAGHWDDCRELLAPAGQEMLARFGEVAAKHEVHIICCNDCVEDGSIYNTAILLGRDGQEIGSYHKVNLPLHESARTPGTHFPVFEAPGIGDIGMCICYDMMFPETTRALALAGADIVFHLTMGGASMASSDASLAAFKTRAVDNFIYIVVAFRGGGSMIISPKGEILADGSGGPDAIVTADIDVNSGRDTGDALGGITTDFRARLFRERVPSAYSILTDEHPPILDKTRDIYVPSREKAARLCAEGLTTGADAFYEAERWRSEGKIEEARQRYEELSEHFGTIWMGRVSRERLRDLEG
ncbi:carbon-nitrogen hydrolase family protein [Candidatus Poribacteria bacterium]